MKPFLALPFVLAGCVAAPPAQVPAPTVEFRLDSQGISVLEPDRLGTAQRIDFGRAQLGVAETMTRMRGQAPEIAQCTDPTMTVLAWDDGLDLVFVNGAFVGWSTQDIRQSATNAPDVGPRCLR